MLYGVKTAHLSRIAQRILTLRDGEIKLLRARVMVLGEDLEIAEGEAGKAQEYADIMEGRWKTAVNNGLNVLEQKEAAEAKLAELEKWHHNVVETDLLNFKEQKGRVDNAEDKLKEIAKLVDSDYNNGMILDGYTLTANIRRILK